MNLGAWRLRASGNYNWMTDSGGNYDFKNRYIQRDIASLRSQFIIGESYTTGETLIPSVSEAFAYTVTAACCLRH